MATHRFVLVAVILGLPGCSDDGTPADDPFGDAASAEGTAGGPTTAEAPTGTDPSSASASASATAADSSTTDPFKFDVGTKNDVPGGACNVGDEDCGCTAVDILFIVDNSGSMQEHAAPTIAAFSTFVDEMIATVPPGTSLHVGVTRATGFFDPGNSGGWGSGACEGFSDGAWNPPDVADNGVNGQQGRLYEHEGARYFEIATDLDPQPLEDWFQGALTGAIDGGAPHSNSETVVAGAAYPFHPANAAYNAGFMREQGVLVLFLLSDSPDLSPAAVPTSDFVDMVSDAKAACGDMCIITTGAIAGQCYDNPMNTNTRLTDFMNGFGQPPPSWINLQFGMVPDFQGVLSAALADVIGSTCENIPPAG
jgi:hypothetical protein